jgi:hypothetical protein
MTVLKDIDKKLASQVAESTWRVLTKLISEGKNFKNIETLLKKEETQRKFRLALRGSNIYEFKLSDQFNNIKFVADEESDKLFKNTNVFLETSLKLKAHKRFSAQFYVKSKQSYVDIFLGRIILKFLKPYGKEVERATKDKYIDKIAYLIGHELIHAMDWATDTTHGIDYYKHNKEQSEKEYRDGYYSDPKELKAMAYTIAEGVWNKLEDLSQDNIHDEDLDNLINMKSDRFYSFVKTLRSSYHTVLDKIEDKKDKNNVINDSLKILKDKALAAKEDSN